MNDEVRKLLDKLLMKVNRVTCPHRHGQGIPRQALDDLSNYQIAVEDKLRKADGEICKSVRIDKQTQG